MPQSINGLCRQAGAHRQVFDVALKQRVAQFGFGEHAT
jgi:hypothetical protein